MNRTARGATRREFVGGVAATGFALVAGCVGGGDEDDDETDTDGTGPDDEPHPELVVDGRALNSAFPLELVEPDADVEGHATGEELIANVQWHENDRHSHWHRAPLSVPSGGTRRARVRFVDSNVEEIPVGAGGEFGVDVSLDEASPENFLAIEVDDDVLELTGEAPGDGKLVFDLLREGEPVWTAPPLDVEVAGEGTDG